MELVFAPFVRKPFSVEAVQVTEKNMKEVAKLLGRVQKEPNGNRYIQVHKGKVPNVTKVYVGYWVTRLTDNGVNLRVYSGKTFTREFAAVDAPKTAEMIKLHAVTKNTSDDTSDWGNEEAVDEEVEDNASAGTV